MCTFEVVTLDKSTYFIKFCYKTKKKKHKKKTFDQSFIIRMIKHIRYEISNYKSSRQQTKYFFT